MVVSKGDIVKIEFPFSDGIGFKVRPALVISNDEVHETGDVLVVQITTKARIDTLTLAIEDEQLEMPLPLKSFIRLHKVFVVEKAMITGIISRINKNKYPEIAQRICNIIL